MNHADANAFLHELQQMCRGKLKPSDFFEVASLMLALHIREPLLSRKLANSYREDNNEQLPAREQIRELKEEDPSAPWDIAKLSHIPDVFFGFFAYAFKGKTEDIPVIVWAIREQYAKRISRVAREELELAERLRLIAQEWHDQKDQSMLDTRCGLGIRLQWLQAKRLVLNEDNPDIARISHYLMIASGQRVELYQQDYLAAACNPSDLLAAPGPTRQQFDRILTEAPHRRVLGEKERSHLQAEFPFLVPPTAQLPSNAATSLWVQQSIKQLNDTGAAYLIVSNGWLSRGGYDGKVRRALVEGGYLQAVVSLDGRKGRLLRKSLLVVTQPSTEQELIYFMNIRTAAQLVEDGKQLRDLASGELLPHKLGDQYPLAVIKRGSLLSKDTPQPSLDTAVYLETFAESEDRPTVEKALEDLADARLIAEAAQNELRALLEKYEP